MAMAPRAGTSRLMVMPTKIRTTTAAASSPPAFHSPPEVVAAHRSSVMNYTITASAPISGTSTTTPPVSNCKSKSSMKRVVWTNKATASWATPMATAVAPPEAPEFKPTFYSSFKELSCPPTSSPRVDPSAENANTLSVVCPTRIENAIAISTVLISNPAHRCLHQNAHWASGLTYQHQSPVAFCRPAHGFPCSFKSPPSVSYVPAPVVNPAWPQ